MISFYPVASVKQTTTPARLSFSHFELVLLPTFHGLQRRSVLLCDQVRHSLSILESQRRVMNIPLLFLVAALAAFDIANAYEQLLSDTVAVKNDTKPPAQRIPGPFEGLEIRADGSPDDTPPPDPPSEAVPGWDKDDIAAQPEADAKAAKGHFATCLLKATDEEAGKAWPDPYKRTPKSARSPFKPTQRKS